MTHMPDLAPYDYHRWNLPPGVRMLAVGWLEPEFPYSTGSVPAEFVHALGQLCIQHQQGRMRGWHDCRLGCPRPGGDDVPRMANGRRLLAPPTSVEIDGVRVVLGSTEIRVIAADGTWLAAPSLVYHYVTEHAYLPPEPFVEAVMAGRVAPECGG